MHLRPAVGGEAFGELLRFQVRVVRTHDAQPRLADLCSSQASDYAGDHADDDARGPARESARESALTYI